MIAIISKEIAKNNDGSYSYYWNAFSYDHKGEKGYIIFGERTREELTSKLKKQGCTIRDFNN